MLVFPVALYLLGVPNAGLSKERVAVLLGKSEKVGELDFSTVKTGGPVTEMRFNDLNGAAYDPEKRESLQGQVVTLKGRFQRVDEKQFTLYKLKMTCCAADTVPLKVQIVTKQSLSGFKDHDWVEVKGQIDFVKSKGSSQYIPVVKVADLSDIHPIAEQSDYE